MQIRQALEAADTDVFLDAATVRGPAELETKDGDLHILGRRGTQLRVGDAGRPGPQRAAAAASPGARGGCASACGGSGDDPALTVSDATIQTSDFGVFIDFMSMFQPDDRVKFTYTKPAEQASFGRALRNIGLLYGHAGSNVFKLTDTPLPPGGDENRIYSRRGWTHLERRLGDLEAPLFNSLDVAAKP